LKNTQVNRVVVNKEESQSERQADILAGLKLPNWIEEAREKGTPLVDQVKLPNWIEEGLAFKKEEDIPGPDVAGFGWRL